MYAPPVLQPALEFLAALAPGGRALEFAIGTGRVALPLSAHGLTVYGIDSSQPMAEVLRVKPGGDRVEVVIGDMAQDCVPGTFDLVYVVYNAITCLLTQGEQVACFRNAARHLRPGGRFVVEVFVPDLQRLPVGDGKASVFHSPHRFVWPSELDLMGELAGLRLLERWADWKRAPFTAESRSHVSVWAKPD